MKMNDVPTCDKCGEVLEHGDFSLCPKCQAEVDAEPKIITPPTLQEWTGYEIKHLQAQINELGEKISNLAKTVQTVMQGVAIIHNRVIEARGEIDQIKDREENTEVKPYKNVQEER